MFEFDSLFELLGVIVINLILDVTDLLAKSFNLNTNLCNDLSLLAKILYILALEILKISKAILE